jgi:hypothetical protein
MGFPGKLSALAFALAGLVILAGPAGAQALKVGDIKVQLFYELSGTLSDDLTKQKNLSLWNTLIGEGDAKEPASSFLVSVVILGKPDSYDKQRAVSVVVTDKTKKSVVMQRQFSGLAFDRSGRVVKALFVENRTCASIEITARSGDSVRTEALPFECGE